MKTTLEPTAKEFLKNRGWNEKSTGYYDFNSLSGLMERYATAAVNAKLQEAAENFMKTIENDKSPANDFAEGYHSGLEEAADCLLDLQIKQQ